MGCAERCGYSYHIDLPVVYVFVDLGTSGFEKRFGCSSFTGLYGVDMNSTNRLIFALILLGAICIAAPAYAYLDPGTGSMLVQMLLGGVAGALVVGKLYWHRIKTFFGRGPAPSPKKDPTADIDDK